MFMSFRHLPKCLVIVAIVLLANRLSLAAEDDFTKIAKQTLSDIHAKAFQAGDIKACVALYADNAKFFVDNKLIASGEEQLLDFYRRLREVDEITTIVVDEFVDIGVNEKVGWAIFTYTKEYKLKNRDPEFIRSHKLEGFSALKVRQYGTAILKNLNGQWKICTMSVFDPEIWEPQK